MDKWSAGPDPPASCAVAPAHVFRRYHTDAFDLWRPFFLLWVRENAHHHPGQPVFVSLSHTALRQPRLTSQAAHCPTTSQPSGYWRWQGSE